MVWRREICRKLNLCLLWEEIRLVLGVDWLLQLSGSDFPGLRPNHVLMDEARPSPRHEASASFRNNEDEPDPDRFSNSLSNTKCLLPQEPDGRSCASKPGH